MYKCSCLESVNSHFCQVKNDFEQNTNITIVLFCLSPEYKKSSTNADVERPEKLTKSNNQVINTIQSKEGTYTLSWINLFLYSKIYFILHSSRFVKLDSCTFLFYTSISYLL